MPEDTAARSQAGHAFPCKSCGATVEFAPGTTALQCPYCGHSQQLVAPQREVQEHSLKALVKKQRVPVSQIAPYSFVCQGCGAHTEGTELSRKCQFCAAPLIANTVGTGIVPPEAVLPFALDRSKARDSLRKWVKSRWFAPTKLKTVTETESAKSTYVPHWTYDSKTASSYTGERGTHYYVSETYTTQVNGRSVTRTRQVRKTRWSPASGNVHRNFDDVLIMATSHVTNKQLAELEPWPLKKALPYRPDYLVGHLALRYDVDPERGFESAKQCMAAKIDKDCRRDIGGDEQRVHSVKTSHSHVTYKLLLLPVWICCYLFSGKTWQVLINGVSGEVQGERPYSAWKIAGAVTAALALIAAIVTLIVIFNGN